MLATHTFSPNWYRPQCLLFGPHHLFYASNYILYDYGLAERKVLRDMCFRKLAFRSGMDFKDIKIHTISHLSEELLVIGTNQPYLVVVDKIQLSPQAILSLH